MDILGILLVALVGGGIPLLTHWSERGLHIALALATGIFLGAVFLHFLPELARLSGEAFEGGSHAGAMWLWLFVLVGVLGVYLVESLVLRTHDHGELHRHRAVSWAALLGMGVHGLTTGIGYGASRGEGEMARALLIAILAHKGFEAFSLTTVFQLGRFKTRGLWLLLFAFALITPLGVWIGTALTSILAPTGKAILTALAAGTFLYVCLSELLPEVFHHRDDGLRKVGLLILGIAITILFEGTGHP